MDKRSLNRRDFLRLSAAAAAGVIVAGCGPTPTPQVVEKVVKETVVVEGTPQVVEKVVKETVVVEATAPPPEAVEIVAVEIVYMGVDESGAGDVAYKVYTDQVIAPFMEQNPDIKVTFQPTVDWGGDTLIAAAAAGNAPDIFAHWGGFGRVLMEEGQMLPLQEHISQKDLDDFQEQQIIAMKIGPSLFALPRYISTMALAYNKDLLDQAGVPYPDETWDWTTFMGAVEKLSKTLGTSEKGKLWAFDVNNHYLATFVWQNGGEWMNKPYMGTKILIDQPAAMEALQYQYDLIFKYGYSPKAADLEGMGWGQTWQTGRFALHEGHSWQVSEYVTVSDWNWDYAILPKGPVARAAMMFNDAHSVYAKTKQPEAAVKFLMYISSPEIEKVMMLSVHGWQPCRKSLIEAWNTESTGAKAGKNVAAFSQILEFSRQDPYFVNNGKVREIFGPLWERIWVTGDLGLEEGVKEIVTKVNEYLDTVA